MADRRGAPAHRRAAPPTPWWSWSSRSDSATGPPTWSPRRPTWPAPWPSPGVPAWARPSPACTSIPTACSSGSPRRRAVAGQRARSRPTRRPWRASAWAGGLGAAPPPTAPSSASVCAGCSASDYRLVVAADGAGSGARLASLLRDVGVDLELDEAGRADLTKPGGRIVVAPLLSGVRAARPQAGGAHRGRPHRPPPRPTAPPARGGATAGGSSTTSSPATSSCTTTTASAATAAWCSAPIGGVERDYLLLEYKGGDKLYVPSDQIDAVRHYAGGEAPALHRLGGSDFARAKAAGAPAVRRDRPGARRAVPEAAEHAGPRLQPDTPWQQELEDVVPVRRDARPAEGHRRRQGRHGGRAADGPPGLRRRRLRQDRGGHPGRVQGRAGRQAGGRAGAHHAAGPAAPRTPSRTASPATRCGSRCSPASSRPARPRR